MWISFAEGEDVILSAIVAFRNLSLNLMWPRKEKIIEMKKEKSPVGNSLTSFLTAKSITKEVNVISMGY